MPASGAKPTILAVDDEELFGVALRRVLGSDYNFTHLTSATEALTRLRAGHQFDVILTDLLLPDLSGPQFYAELEKLQPSPANRVLFMTGGAATDEARDFLQRISNRCLRKPFEQAELIQAIQAVLGAPRAG